MKKIEVVCVLFIHLFLSCTNVNERDIKLMHLNGDVVKIETVSLTSVPIMEMSMNNNPKRCIAVTIRSCEALDLGSIATLITGSGNSMFSSIT